MNEVLIRNIQSTDVPQIKTMIDEAWNISDSIESQETLNATLGLYLNRFLFNSTFGKVAIVNGEVVGLILGNLNKEKPTYRMLIEDSTALSLALMKASETDRENISEFLSKTLQTNEELIKDRIGDYQGSLELFVVSEKARGLKIGKRLWHELQSYFENHHTQAIYLYTDTTCNFRYYDHNGFIRQSQQDVTLEFVGEQYPLTFFLYDYQFKY